MKAFVLRASAVCLGIATPSVQALRAEAEHDHVAHVANPRPAGVLSDEARKAVTPGARKHLMQENMVAMKAQMAEMHSMMADGSAAAGKPMAMGMTMDADHMGKMHRHMTMMQDMMERLMVQQQLMMKSAK